MDTPETNTNIVFNDDARKLPNGTINLTGQWSAIQTVPLADSLVNRPTGLEDLQIALKAHIEERLYADGMDFAYLAPITVSELPKSAMADQYGATAFIVRTSLKGAKDGEYLALDVLEVDCREQSEVWVDAGNFKRIEVAKHGACWLLVSGMVKAAAKVIGTDAPETTETSDAPASPPNAIQAIIEFDPATQGFTCGIVQNGQAVENPNPYALLQMLNQFMDGLISKCAAHNEHLVQTLREKDGDANQSRLVVASANTPLPPMPRMKQNPRRN